MEKLKKMKKMKKKWNPSFFFVVIILQELEALGGINV